MYQYIVAGFVYAILYYFVFQDPLSEINTWAPYANIQEGIQHYLFVSLYFTGFLYYQWIPLPKCTCKPKIVNDRIDSASPTKNGSNGDDPEPTVAVKRLKSSSVARIHSEGTLYHLDSGIRTLPLNALTEEGKKLGKRGSNKPFKLDSQKARLKSEEMFNSNAIPTIEHERDIMSDGKMDAEEAKLIRDFQFNTDHSDKISRTLRELNDNIKNISLMIFEYYGVLSTQNAQQLRDKMERWYIVL